MSIIGSNEIKLALNIVLQNKFSYLSQALINKYVLSYPRSTQPEIRSDNIGLLVREDF